MLQQIKLLLGTFPKNELATNWQLVNLLSQMLLLEEFTIMKELQLTVFANKLLHLV